MFVSDIFFINEVLTVYYLGNHEVHGDARWQRLVCDNVGEKVVSSTGHSSFCRAGDSICCFEKYQSHCSEKVRLHVLLLMYLLTIVITLTIYFV